LVDQSDKRTAELKMVLSSTDFREYILVNAIEDLKFDVVIFDCAPSVDVLHTAALLPVTG
jgi:cellulose biosynthesis protein BcsQ